MNAETVEIPRLLTMIETAKALKVSRTQIYKLVKAGEFQTYKVAGRTVCLASEINDYLDRCLCGAGESAEASSKLSEDLAKGANGALLAHRTRQRLIGSSHS